MESEEANIFEITDLDEENLFHGGITLPNKDLIVFFGANNCGKSSILGSINKTFGDLSDYISPQRFNIQNKVNLEAGTKKDLERQFKNRKENRSEQSEKGAPPSMTELILLGDQRRDQVLRWHNHFFGELKIEKEDPNNSFSQPIITIDDSLPSQQGSGSRAILPILVKLLDPELKVVCIDEPEIGIEPKTQKRLFELIKKVTRGEDELPKKKVVIATHSHIFVDKEDYSNNFKVEKTNSIVTFEPIEDQVDLQSCVFGLLGNDPSDLFFPSNIVVVEGGSDKVFLQRVYELMQSTERIKKGNIAFHFCGGYDKAGAGVEAVVQMLKTQGYMPIYLKKICGIFDNPQQNAELIDKIRTFVKDTGKERFVLLDKDAIEYYYPLGAVRIAVEDPKISSEELNDEVAKFLQQYKSQGTGDFFSFKKIKKADLATRITLVMEDLEEIDDSIISLISKAQELAF